MRLLIVLLTMLASFLSLLAVIATAKAFGFMPANFHNPDRIFDSLTLTVALGVLLLPILIVTFAYKILLHGKGCQLGWAGPFLKPISTGFLIGTGLKVLATGAAFLISPMARVADATKNVGLVEWLPYFAWFTFALVLNSLSEELAYRAFPLISLPQRSPGPRWGAVLGASSIFSLMHFLLEPFDGPHFFYRLLFGILAGGLFLQEQSLWLVVGLHTGWNFIALSLSDGHWKTGTLVLLEGLGQRSELMANIAVLTGASLAVLVWSLRRTGELLSMRISSTS